MDFWSRMDEAISAAGKTRKGVAMEFGFTVGNFGSWKSRGDYPKVDMAFKIAQYVGTTVEYLMTGERKARYGLPPRVADMVEDLLLLDDHGLNSVATLARGLAEQAATNTPTPTPRTPAPRDPSLRGIKPPGHVPGRTLEDEEKKA